MFCPKCGEQIPDDSTFCPVCGQAIDDAMTDEDSSTSEDWNTGVDFDSENMQSDYGTDSDERSYEDGYRKNDYREQKNDFPRKSDHISNKSNGGGHRNHKPVLIVIAMAAVAVLAVFGTLLIQNHSISQISTNNEETTKSVSTMKKTAEDKKDNSEKTTVTPTQRATETPTPTPTAVPSPTQAPQVIVVTPSTTPVPTAPPTVIYTSDDYIFPYSDTYLLTDADLAGKSAWELTVGRNEIAARHGYVFNREDLQDYFNSKDWYYPTGKFDLNTVLSSTELRNMSFIDKYQNAHGLQTS